MKKIIILVVILLAVALGFASHRETVAEDQVGVRTFLGQTKVFAPGERVIVLPVVHKYVTLTTKPVSFLLKGVGAVVVSGPDSTSLTVECKVRYQIDDSAKFIADVGIENPDNALNDRLRAKIKEILQQHLRNKDLDLTKITTRMLLTGETIHSLNDEKLSPGVNILSFELLNW